MEAKPSEKYLAIAVQEEEQRKKKCNSISVKNVEDAKPEKALYGTVEQKSNCTIILLLLFLFKITCCLSN